MTSEARSEKSENLKYLAERLESVVVDHNLVGSKLVALESLVTGWLEREQEEKAEKRKRRRENGTLG